MDIQKMIEAMSESMRNERSNYHITLGGLIDVLEKNKDCKISINEPHSYRGYYSDLAFQKCDLYPVSELLSEIYNNVLDKDFEGYKGGEYTMTKDVPLWVANWGSCGDAIIAIARVGDELNIIAKNVD